MQFTVQKLCTLLIRVLNLLLMDNGSLWCDLHVVLNNDNGIVGAQNLDAWS